MEEPSLKDIIDDFKKTVEDASKAEVKDESRLDVMAVKEESTNDVDIADSEDDKTKPDDTNDDMEKGDSDDCYMDEVTEETDSAKSNDTANTLSHKTSVPLSNILIIETETDSGERSYKCSLCSKSYKFKKSAEYHKKMQHKAYCLFCQVCGKTFKLQYDLDRHLNVHKGIRPFPCPECDKSFVCRSSQMRHRKLHHLVGDIYKCHNCDKTFRVETDLKRHLFTHTGERPWSCDHCSKSFVSKSSLKVHAKSHDDSKKFTCLICHKMFHIKTDLTRHESTHTGDLKWECAVCQKKYSGKSAVKRHIKDSHIFGKVKCRKGMKSKGMKIKDLLDFDVETNSNVKEFEAVAKYKEDNSVENLLKVVDSFVIYKGDTNDLEIGNKIPKFLRIDV